MERRSVLSLLEFTPLVMIGIGPLQVSPHGIATAVGFIAGARLLLPATRRQGVPDEIVYRMLYRSAFGALVGARVAYAVNHWSDYADAPLTVFAIWEGGISLFGGIAGGVVAAVPVMRAERLCFWPLMDAAAPGLALGIAIGRVGDLMVGDHLGRTTDFALGFRCTGAGTASRCAAPIGQGVHMPALYDMVSASTLLAALLLLRRRSRRDGFLILAFAAWYGTGRFIEDFFRIDDPVAFGLSGSQLTALTLVVAAAGWLVVRRVGPQAEMHQEGVAPGAPIDR
ncbi:MAG: prolipoprotein diacylglyceryl transferase [Acidimicrobiia bacterium]|nr:prolipoprotein diacylglyceryl transferase [Acidimicrobiia bacterium]